MFPKLDFRSDADGGRVERLACSGNCASSCSSAGLPAGNAGTHPRVLVLGSISLSAGRDKLLLGCFLFLVAPLSNDVSLY